MVQGLVLITVITGVGYGCHKEGEAECIGYTQKALFISAMVLIALGRAARFACAQPFIADQDQTKHEEDQTTNKDVDETNNNDQTAEHDDDQGPTSCTGTGSVTMFVICLILFFCMPTAAFFAFPHVKKWYLLFGVSAVCTAFAALIFLTGFREYNKPGARSEGSPITDFMRVLVAAAFNKSQPSPKPGDPCLHVTEDEEFKELSASRFLRYVCLI